MGAAKIKKGDSVVVLSGKDKGRTGTVSKVMPKEGKLVVDGVNVAARHRKPSQANPQGGIDRFPAPMHISKVALADPKDGSRTILGIGQRNLGDVHRCREPVDTTLRVCLARLAVTGSDIDAVDNQLALFRHNLADSAGAALVLARKHDNAVAFFDLCSTHDQSTSGASEMIFMKPRPRNSRTTGPKIRVPIGSSFLFTRTAALLSKRITLPSLRRTSLRVRTITAR